MNVTQATQLAASFNSVKTNLTVLNTFVSFTCFWTRWHWVLRWYSILFVQMIIFQKQVCYCMDAALSFSWCFPS